MGNSGAAETQAALTELNKAKQRISELEDKMKFMERQSTGRKNSSDNASAEASSTQYLQD